MTNMISRSILYYNAYICSSTERSAPPLDDISAQLFCFSLLLGDLFCISNFNIQSFLFSLTSKNIFGSSPKNDDIYMEKHLEKACFFMFFHVLHQKNNKFMIRIIALCTHTVVYTWHMNYFTILVITKYINAQLHIILLWFSYVVLPKLRKLHIVE